MMLHKEFGEVAVLIADVVALGDNHSCQVVQCQRRKPISAVVLRVVVEDLVGDENGCLNLFGKYCTAGWIVWNICRQEACSGMDKLLERYWL